MRREDIIRETLLNNKIFALTVKMNKHEATCEEQEELACDISIQKTKTEILELGSSLPKHKILDYVIFQVGRATKKYQLERKKLRQDKVEELRNELNEAVDTFDANDPEILRIEEEMDSTIEEICETERGKMKTFRMLNDERPTKHMIELEKKLCGYTSVSRINKPNPDYVPPEKGGPADEILNPKKFLLTDPKVVRKVMRDAMQEIYLKQEGVTPEQPAPQVRMALRSAGSTTSGES